ncbi:hypothetical protein [Acinetobacter sp. 197]|uniref:hypothetical protein n=1 Tax=Acinetobacter sp. 197 TaxID=3114696 RepID=UPI003A873A58
MSEVYSITPPVHYGYVRFATRFVTYKPKGGAGYFASTFPDYLITVEGRPAPGEIRVLLRTGGHSSGDGMLVAKTLADNTGQWRVDGLNPDFRYDVVCRVEGYNDIIFSNVKPKV